MAPLLPVELVRDGELESFASFATTASAGDLPNVGDTIVHQHIVAYGVGPGSFEQLVVTGKSWRLFTHDSMGHTALVLVFTVARPTDRISK